MIDFHSHVLPGLDDGSRDEEESLAMLRASGEQGIGCVAATPHFYPWEQSPEEFLAARGAAAERLANCCPPGLPRVLLGAEVHYFEGMAQVGELEELCLEGTRLLLLEMPFAPWTERMVKEAASLHTQRGFQVLLAHVERYLAFQGKAVWEDLLAEGVLMQSNASFFLDWRTRGRARRMLREGRVHLLGSDCHNMETRPPLLGSALEKLREGERAVLEENAALLLPGLETRPPESAG